ncbi:hypothetical protein [uncultured Rikenella sp.]|uniref:hypothetical protein n=1 Tax=uncultured Rikenella sp. TaxID=368003 RepID=UPI002613488E|nr:hypothetical protein [uncultured Rikenella sp.]
MRGNYFRSLPIRNPSIPAAGDETRQHGIGEFSRPADTESRHFLRPETRRDSTGSGIFTA